MVFFANSNDIIVVDIEVTEKIDDRYLKSFVLSNLKLKNISLENCDKLYVNYLEYPKEYQVFLVNSQFIFFDFEAFCSYYENRDFEGFELLIYSNFFLIFKDKKFFYYQKINQDLNQDDFIKFLNKKFNIKDIPMDDALVYQSFAEGNTIGIFQFESPGMRKTLKNIKPRLKKSWFF